MWRYELLKYMRSWRLVASIAISVLVLLLITLLPPALGSSYSGEDTDVELHVTTIPANPLTPEMTFAPITRTGVNIDNLVVYRNGTEYSPDLWDMIKIDNAISDAYLPLGTYAILFYTNVSGSAMTADYDWRIAPQDFDTLIVQFAYILIIICATFFGSDSLVGEFHTRTGYLIFPNPVKREVLFFGKYMASVTAGAIVVSIFYLGLTGASFAAAGGVDDDLGLSYLFAIHEHHEVHQTLDPFLVFLLDQSVKLANFACPRVEEDDEVSHIELKAYVAPGVLRGERVTPAANVFSLGVLGFRLTAGSLPYPLTFDEPFPYRLESMPADLEEIPLPLQNLLLQCLAPDPPDRFEDAGAFLVALEQRRELWRTPQERWIGWTPEGREGARGAAAQMFSRLWDGGKSAVGKIGEGFKTLKDKGEPGAVREHLRPDGVYPGG